MTSRLERNETLRVRYLYGDSSPFPHGYDFLATLETFMTTATRVVQLSMNASKVEDAADQGLLARMKELEQIEQFHTGTVEALGEAAKESQSALVREYASHVIQSAIRTLADNKGRTQAENERVQQGAAMVAQAAKKEIEQHLDHFMRTVRLPTEHSRVKVSLAAGRTDSWCTLTHAMGIVCEFDIDVAATSWGKARKVSEFTTAVDLLIGAKKAWFSSQVTPERIHLDDFFIGDVDVQDDGCLLLLRKKPDQPDSYVFTASKANGVLDVRVDRPGMAEAGSLSEKLEAGDVAVFERLYTALQGSTGKLTSLRSRLRACRVDNVSALDPAGSLRLVERMVALFAPTVAEIAARSPNPHELSLKRETDEGKREELYLRRDDLHKKMEPLAGDGRRIFAPLGLEAWMPGLSQAPPAVSTGQFAAQPQQFAPQPPQFTPPPPQSVGHFVQQPPVRPSQVPVPPSQVPVPPSQAPAPPSAAPFPAPPISTSQFPPKSNG